MSDDNQSTAESPADSSETGASHISSTSHASHMFWPWLLLAAVLAVVIGVVVQAQFGDYFQISQEMADIAPDSARSAEAEAAIANTRRNNQFLVISVIVGCAGLLFGIAGGQITKRRRMLAAIAGLVIGTALGIVSVFAADMIDTRLAITPDSTTTVESQDTQKLIKAAASQWVFFLAMCGAVTCVMIGSGAKKVAVGIAVLVASVISVAAYQATLAIGFPGEPFDQLIPSGAVISWFWLAIPVLVSSFACSRLSAPTVKIT